MAAWIEGNNGMSFSDVLPNHVLEERGLARPSRSDSQSVRSQVFWPKAYQAREGMRTIFLPIPCDSNPILLASHANNLQSEVDSLSRHAVAFRATIQSRLKSSQTWHLGGGFQPA